MQEAQVHPEMGESLEKRAATHFDAPAETMDRRLATVHGVRSNYKTEQLTVSLLGEKGKHTRDERFLTMLSGLYNIFFCSTQ